MIFYFDAFYLITVMLAKNINVVYIFKRHVAIRVTPQGQCACVKQIVVRRGLGEFQPCNWEHNCKPHKWGIEYSRTLKTPSILFMQKTVYGGNFDGLFAEFPLSTESQAGTCPIQPPSEKQLNWKATVSVPSLCLLISKMELT